MVLNTPLTLLRIPYFYLISWCGSFVGRWGFHRVSSDLPESLRKVCLSTKFTHLEIRWNWYSTQPETKWTKKILLLILNDPIGNWNKFWQNKNDKRVPRFKSVRNLLISLLFGNCLALLFLCYTSICNTSPDVHLICLVML